MVRLFNHQVLVVDHQLWGRDESRLDAQSPSTSVASAALIRS
jgi:hypothetical protein